MTREHVKALLPVLQAYAEGKAMQVWYPVLGWLDKAEPEFTQEAKRYRIKREPRKFWGVSRSLFFQHSHAVEWSNKYGGEIIELQEVL